MTQSPPIKLSLGKKLRLVALGVAVLVLPVVCGFMSAPHLYGQSGQPGGASLPSFDVASVKQNRSENGPSMTRVLPDRFIARNWTTKALIASAYRVRENQVSGGPAWINTDRYDVEAKVEDSLLKELQKLSPAQRAEQRSLMIQSLLAGRFKLSVSNMTKELPVYALVVAKGGPKFSETTATPIGSLGNSPEDEIRALSIRLAPGEIKITGTIGNLADELSRQLGRDVLDRTELIGIYDLALTWAPYERQAQSDIDDNRPLNSSGPSIFAAIQEQLGLKLEPEKGPVKILVIDHVERPSEN